mmetsp:Transcript_15506/g.37768  ORF Transcript_15506/g.37768 Transcript_15506/m.37768 type:complete len:118 (-) Transcript_15506:96-449(-)
MSLCSHCNVTAKTLCSHCAFFCAVQKTISSLSARNRFQRQPYSCSCAHTWLRTSPSGPCIISLFVEASHECGIDASHLCLCACKGEGLEGCEIVLASLRYLHPRRNLPTRRKGLLKG